MYELFALGRVWHLWAEVSRASWCVHHAKCICWTLKDRSYAGSMLKVKPAELHRKLYQHNFWAWEGQGRVTQGTLVLPVATTGQVCGSTKPGKKGTW